MIKKITRLAIVLISICIYVWRRPYVESIPLIIMIVLFWLNVISLFKILTKGWKCSKKFSMFIALATAITYLLMIVVYSFLDFAVTHSICYLVLGIISVGIIMAGGYAIYKAMKESKENSNIIQFPRRSGR